jgi:hypothetical protein
VYEAPNSAQHSGYCGAFVFRWRFEVWGTEGRPDINLAVWPCKCLEPRPWELHETEHPSWCIVDRPHTWDECTFIPSQRKAS